jgi:AraC family transcriptional regulator
MTFHPRMKSRIQGFSVIEDLRWRAWNGVVADVWNVACSKGAEGEYVSPNPRLFVALEMHGEGGFLINEAAAREYRRHSGSCPMSFVPADLPIRGRVEQLSRIRHLDLHFDAAVLMQRFGNELDPARLAEPRIMFHDERVARLAILIAEECSNDRPLSDLYGNGLLDALIAALFGIDRKMQRRRSQLSRTQLRRVTDYIEDHCLQTIRLSDLAGLIGLSDSYFSHAFKATTGVAPHRWHLQARVRRVQELLSRSDVSLTEIATATGFADQAHFTRVFKQLVGVSPAIWVRDFGNGKGRSATRSAQEDTTARKNVQSLDKILR